MSWVCQLIWYKAKLLPGSIVPDRPIVLWLIHKEKSIAVHCLWGPGFSPHHLLCLWVHYFCPQPPLTVSTESMLIVTHHPSLTQSPFRFYLTHLHRFQPQSQPSLLEKKAPPTNRLIAQSQSGVELPADNRIAAASELGSNRAIRGCVVVAGGGCMYLRSIWHFVRYIHNKLYFWVILTHFYIDF